MKLGEHLDKASATYSMEISTEKTKLMANNTSGIDKDGSLRQSQASSTWAQLYLMRVPSLRTLQDSTDNSSIDRDETTLNDMSILLSSKIQLMYSLVTSTFLYACESWTLTAELHRRIQAMEMRCYCRMLRISYKDHVTNEEIRAKIQQAIGPH